MLTMTSGSSAMTRALEPLAALEVDGVAGRDQREQEQGQNGAHGTTLIRYRRSASRRSVSKGIPSAA